MSDIGPDDEPKRMFLMSVTKNDVQKVAQLARLRLTEEEETRLVTDLNQMLAYVASLSELDTSNVQPTTHVLPLSNVFRPDEPTESLPQDLALANAPKSGHGHFRVPKVIE
jgi:aspartyl-tRNA(Asn)/glutamyl-tRNA(Gln) amidotransferase subunit C